MDSGCPTRRGLTHARPAGGPRPGEKIRPANPDGGKEPAGGIARGRAAAPKGVDRALGGTCHHGRMPYRSLSYWLGSVPGDLTPGDPLPGDLDVDVAIAGAGFTGLCTAYYLACASPGLRIAVCEREIAGLGASRPHGGGGSS